MASPTVFISSRMEELAFERRSAFDALYLSGFTPLAFETEPTGESEKHMIDNLVDSADLFMGLYYETIGAHQHQLENLEPIAYELYRFLFRYRDREITALGKSSRAADLRAALDALLKDRKAIDDLRAQLSAGALNDLLSRRVRIFQLIHNYDAAVSRRLTEFLLPLHQGSAQLKNGGMPFMRTFQPSREYVSGPVVEAAKKCERFMTAGFQLFSLTDEVVEEAVRAGLRFPPEDKTKPTNAGPYFQWRVTGQDDPGVLFVALDAIFKERFNVEMVCAGEPVRARDEDPRRLVIDVVGRPFLPNKGYGKSAKQRHASVVRFLCKNLPEGYEVTGSRIRSWPDHRKPQWVTRQKEGRFYYVVEVADVPGQVLGLAKRILFYQANIDLLFFDSRSDSLLRPKGRKGRAAAATILFIVSPSSPESIFFEPMYRARFLAEIRQGLGVLGVQELSTKKEFYSRMNESRRRIVARAPGGEVPFGWGEVPFERSEENDELASPTPPYVSSPPPQTHHL